MLNDQQQSQDESGYGKPKAQKKRRFRACDMCRRRKVRCDGDSMPENRCSNCITFDFECTYVEGSNKRYADASYVQGLETELASLRALLKKLHPDIEDPYATSRSFSAEGTLDSTMMPGGSKPSSGVHRVPQIVDKVDADDADSSDDEVVAVRSLSKTFQKFSLQAGHSREHSHFFGKSSNFMLVQAAMEFKQEYVSNETLGPDTPAGQNILLHKRSEFWLPPSWILDAIKDVNALVFPEADLMSELISLYFTRLNLYLPLLHQPTFVHNVQTNLHLNDRDFGCTLLLVCAIGARYSEDPRVLLEGTEDWHSAGWKWFKQVQTLRKEFRLTPTHVYDLQIACLSATFLNGTSLHGASWGIVGAGIRVAQDIGAHRRKTYSTVPTVEGELRKRAFWILVSIDRNMCSWLGRPYSIQDEDLDVDFPIECDDEYWIHPDPNMAFTQPPGKPSTVTYFNSILRLGRLHAFTIRTIYSINKSKVLHGLAGPEYEQQIVSEIDSELNKWIDSVPDHLRWDPYREDTVFMNQSALLYSTYYALQIAVHRPFIPSPRKPSPMSFPSLAICTNAARACINALDIQYNRTGTSFHHHWHQPLFASGIVLLLSIWGAKRSGSATNPAKGMSDVHKAMRLLKVLETRWHAAGKFWDLLYDLASMGDLPLPQTFHHKRSRDDDKDIPSPSSSDASSLGAVHPGEPRNVAGSKRVQQYQHASFSPPFLDPYDVDTSFGDASGQPSLPTHGDDLARMWSLPASNFPLAQACPANSTAIPLDPSLDAVFSDTIPPELYEQLLRSLDGTPSPIPFQQFVNVPAGSLSNEESLKYIPPGISTGDIGQFFPQQSDRETVNIWSNVPTSFEWEDWGTYFTNMTR